jgi:serine/threonine-protein kinase
MSWTSSDGAHPPEPLIKGAFLTPASFTADGKRLLFFEQKPGSGSLIKTVEVKNESGRPQVGEPQLFLETPSTNPFPAFSPDGRWVAYASAEAGVYEVYVRAFPDSGTRRFPVSTNGGNIATWSSNGRELFYLNEDRRIMVASYTVKASSFILDPPRLWSDKQLANIGISSSFDLTPSGKRFAVLMPAEASSSREPQNHITLVLNFFDELRRRVPAVPR